MMQKKGGEDTTNASNETNSATNIATTHAITHATTTTTTTRSNDTYVYGVGILAVLAIGVCVFFAYPKNKKQDIDHRYEQKQPPKRHHVL